MKAILEYDLDDVDDKMAHLRAVKSLDMACCLFEILRNTKKGLEWELENKEIDSYETLELIFNKIWEVVDDHNIKIDELVC